MTGQFYYKNSPIAGIGMFASNDIVKGQIITEYLGTECTYKEMIALKGKDPRGIYRTMPWLKQLIGIPENPVNFVNHQIPPNSILKKKLLICINDIKKDDEITLDYGKRYWNWISNNTDIIQNNYFPK